MKASKMTAKQLTAYNRRMGTKYKGDVSVGTICWACKNLRCSWIRNLTPVAGWSAVRNDLVMQGGKLAKSYFVCDCPEFVKQSERQVEE